MRAPRMDREAGMRNEGRPPCVPPRYISPQAQQTLGAPLPSPAGSPCCCLTALCPAATRPGGGEKKPCS